MNDELIASLTRYIGRTVTIFTTSGGISGSGFSGVLAGVSCNTVRLITGFGAAPACPIGSSCGGGFMQANADYGFNSGAGGCGCGGYNNNAWLGSITEIPICKIACFTHNSI